MTAPFRAIGGPLTLFSRVDKSPRDTNRNATVNAFRLYFALSSSGTVTVLDSIKGDIGILTPSLDPNTLLFLEDTVLCKSDVCVLRRQLTISTLHDIVSLKKVKTKGP